MNSASIAWAVMGTGLVSGILACGGVRDYLPEGPPLTADRRAEWLAQKTKPVVQDPPTDERAPVAPLQFFSAYYAQDIVLETKKSPWSMHEYAQVLVGDRMVWIAKDSDREGIQTATADIADIEGWLPDIPIPRHDRPMTVEDRSTDERLDVTIRYENPLGTQTTVEFSGPLDAKLEGKRNSSTFNHSQQAASVVLDVRRRQQKGVKATVTFEDEEAKIRKVLGLVPVKALLEQIQSGIAAASMEVSTTATATRIIRPAPGIEWPTTSTETWSWSGQNGDGTLMHEAFGARHRYTFEGAGLAKAEVHVDGLEEPGVVFELSAPLPDVTRPFEGRVQRNFALSVGGQPHGYGLVTAEWRDGTAVVRVEPKAPRWFEARPVVSTIVTQGGISRVESRIVDPKTGEPREVVR